MDDFLINGVVSFFGALAAVLIGVTLPRYFEKSDFLNKQKKWSEFFYQQIFDISSKAKYSLDIEGGAKPLLQYCSSEVQYPEIMDMQDEMYHLLSYDFTINIEIYNHYKDNITLLNPKKVFYVLKIYEIIIKLEKIKTNGIASEITTGQIFSEYYIDQIKSNLKSLVDPEILDELKKDF